jgi:hypothetical protein
MQERRERMVQKPLKKQYVTPKLKEHGIVRELTQSSTGSPGMSMGMSMGMGLGMGMS